MKHEYFYEADRILLRPLEETDIESLRLLRNSLKQYYVSRTEVDAESQKRWYQSYLQKENDIMFAVVKKDRQCEFIGAMALYAIDWDNGIAEVGRSMIDKEKAPEKGIGSEALKATCEFGFDVLKLKKIVAEVRKSNSRIIHVTSQLGFQTVGEKEDLYLIELTPKTIRR